MNRKFLLSITTFSLVLTSFFAGKFTQNYVFAQAPETISICHSTSSHSNPYIINNPAKSADVKGHDDHDGGIFPASPWGDIIPPFDYGDGKHYDGKNWTPEGIAIWENECNIPGEDVYHSVCREYACVSVKGEGETTCDTDADCEVEESIYPSMSSNVSCGSVELTFRNPTKFFFSFDYRVDNEVGHDDQYSAITIANGPYAGMFFGQRYNEVDVIAGSTELRTVNFSEDTGIHTVAYRLWRGAENDWYLPWEEVQVESDCEPNGGGDICANIDGIQTSVPDGYHLDAGGVNCVQFSVPGAPEPSDGPVGQVLGASTMAGTGVAESSIFYSIFSLGSLLTSLGIMKNGKKRD